MTGQHDAGVLIPVKAFHEAKVRLAPALDPRARARLARAMAATVVQAANGLPVWVVCDDDDVASWATDVGATVLWRPGLGLNGAVTDGVAALADLGVDRAIVAHADLPHAVDLRWAASGAGVALVPDRHDDGTNVIALPTRCALRFAYGPGSFRRHHHAAVGLGLDVEVVRDERLMWDVDVPEDLDPPAWATASAGGPSLPEASA